MSVVFCIHNTKRETNEDLKIMFGYTGDRNSPSQTKIQDANHYASNTPYPIHLLLYYYVLLYYWQERQ